MCCEVLGICRSIWNKFRFECCGQCSTTKILRRMSEDFLFVVGGAELEQGGSDDAKSAEYAISPVGLLLSPRFLDP